MTQTARPPKMSRSTETPRAGFIDEAEDRLLAVAEDAKTELVKAMDAMVLQAHSLAATIDSMAGAQAGDLARQAADVLASVQRGLDEKAVSELVSEGQALIRRQPAAALGIAVASGFLLARLLRAPKQDGE